VTKTILHSFLRHGVYIVNASILQSMHSARHTSVPADLWSLHSDQNHFTTHSTRCVMCDNVDSY